MDGLSVAASVIAVVQISGQVFDLCRKYYLEVKSARKEIQRLRDEVISLQDVLTSVADLPKAPSSTNQSTLRLLSQPNGPLQRCQIDLEKLVVDLNPGPEHDKMKQFGSRALQWPFNSKAVDKAITTIERYKQTFNLALTADHITLSREIQDEISRLQDGITEMQIGQSVFFADERRQKIYRWLSSPDPSSNHNAARKKQQQTTGAWFIEGYQFADWKVTSSSFLWLHGIPGCGKTVLCSTVIQDVILYCQSDQGLAVIYFYFDFSNLEKQLHESLVRSLVMQLSMQSATLPEALDLTYSRCQDGNQQPTADTLLLTLRRMLEDFKETFIIVDALDECTEREELLGLIDTIVGWKFERLHILATSRREKDIEETLSPLITSQIDIQSTLVTADIQVYVHERLQSDPKLRKWPTKVQQEIEATLTGQAHGMFRWVVCQLDELRTCLKLETLYKRLKSLPKTLDATYDRILHSIDEEYAQDALKVLSWLAYAARPVRIEEAAEVIAINVEGHPQFNPENRLPEPRDILTICSSLVTTVTSSIRVHQDGVPEIREIEEIKLAHFSVKEYLVSGRVQTWAASRYKIYTAADNYIAQICLTYLLYFRGPTMLTPENIHEFPLAMYAAQYWTEHARKAEKMTDSILIRQLSMELFLSERDSYLNCVRLFTPDKPGWGTDMTIAFESIISPLYYVSLTGFLESVLQLVKLGADVNVQCGVYGCALQAASYRGHFDIVQALLKAGAYVDTHVGEYGNALQAASDQGHEAIVQLLLDSGADVNAQTGEYGNALQSASRRGYYSIVQRLLEAGADVHAQGGWFNNALYGASFEGHDNIVQLLIKWCANVNLAGGYFGNALRAASYRRNDAVVQRLLKAGATLPNEPTGITDSRGPSLFDESTWLHQQAQSLISHFGQLPER